MGSMRILDPYGHAILMGGASYCRAIDKQEDMFEDHVVNKYIDWEEEERWDGKAVARQRTA